MTNKNDYMTEHIKNKRKIEYFWLLLLLVFLIVFLFGSLNKIKGQTYQEVRDYIYDSTDIKHKEIVLRQSLLETGLYKCTNCSLDKNNIFGWYYKKKYLSFTHWKESIQYYFKWQNKWYKEGDYYSFLECIYKHGDGRCVRYATDPKYIDKLKAIKL